MDLALASRTLRRLAALVAPVVIALASALAAPVASADVTGGSGLVASVAAQEALDVAAAPDDLGVEETGEEAVATVAEPAAAVDAPPPVEAPAAAAAPEAAAPPVAPAAAAPPARQAVTQTAPTAVAEPVVELVPTTRSTDEQPDELAPILTPAVPTVEQAVPSLPNLNVDIRILSPGDDGDVVQGGGVLVGGAPIAPPDSGDGDWTWNWTWNWDTDCAPGDVPTPMTVAAGGWSWDWTWDWSCGDAPAQPAAPSAPTTAPLPAIATPPTVAPLESVAPGAAPVVAADEQRPMGRSTLDDRQSPTPQPLAAPVPARVRTAVLAPALSTVANPRGTAHASAGALPGPDPAGEPPTPDPWAPTPSAAGAGATSAAGTGSLMLAALLAALTMLAPRRGRRMRGHAHTPRQPLDSRRPERPG
jgi:hypothetical protein